MDINDMRWQSLLPKETLISPPAPGQGSIPPGRRSDLLLSTPWQPEDWVHAFKNEDTAFCPFSSLLLPHVTKTAQGLAGGAASQ